MASFERGRKAVVRQAIEVRFVDEVAVQLAQSSVKEDPGKEAVSAFTDED